MTHVKLTECPRDAMQGLPNFIPTEIKAAYINLLLQCGFDTIDFGSFVSPKAIPQMQDTLAVLNMLDLSNTRSKLLAIVANYRGAQQAVAYKQITYLGFPFSISETFQMRNTNSSIIASLAAVEKIQDLCVQNDKHLRIYLSMGFGNPYGDKWDIDILLKWADEIKALGIDDIYLADTIGVATEEQITEVFSCLSYNKSKLGIHLHSTPGTALRKIDAAYKSGCRRFDTALKGYGGCPMAKDDLTGNIATEELLGYLENNQIDTGINKALYAMAMEYSVKVFV